MALQPAINHLLLLRRLSDSSELRQLERLLRRFNLFEALGVVRRELRHSDFLAFLLDPQQNHELGDAFTRRFIQSVSAKTQGDVAIVDSEMITETAFRNVEIRREWKNIDILLIDYDHNCFFVIENKINTGEHSDQLARYRHTAYQAYPTWNIIGVFLTPDGSLPLFDEYVALSYQQVSTIIQGILEDQSLSIAADVRIMLSHYVQMLGRHIVAESDTAKLCRRIYKQHKQALDLIFEYRDDQRQRTLRDTANKLIKRTPHLVADWSYKWDGKHCADFTVREWHTPSLLRSTTDKNKCLLRFSFKSEPTEFYLELHITPGAVELRQELLDMARSKQPPFEVDSSELQEWHWIYGREFLTEEMYEDASDDELAAELRRQWAAFLGQDLPMIVATVASW